MTNTTDTPRTDAFVAENSLLAFVEDKYELTLAFARQLERELAASQDEVGAFKKLAIELVQELISKCDDPIHREQLDELLK